MTITEILAGEVKAGRLGFSAAVHRLAEMSEMELLTAKRMIHEAMNPVDASLKSTEGGTT